ncbi:MAG: DNA-binding protein WhiA [Anaerovoracaceae bacterium]
MSFSSDIKNELAHTKPDKDCCKLAEIAGFVRMSGRIGLLGGGKLRLRASTNNSAVARHYRGLISEIFGVTPEIKIDQSYTLKKGKYFSIVINPEDNCQDILSQLGLLSKNQGMSILNDGIDESLVPRKCCRRAFLKGAFLGAGTISNPVKGHHFEISCSSEAIANDLRRVINAFTDILSKKIQRKNGYGIYIKSSPQIVDLLAIMGAPNMLFKYEDILMQKEVKAKTNRISNCDTANIERTMFASDIQIQCMEFLYKVGEFENLADKEKEIAKIRLLEPEATIEELGRKVSPPVKKTAAFNRLQKIIDFAQLKSREKGVSIY